MHVKLQPFVFYLTVHYIVVEEKCMACMCAIVRVARVLRETCAFSPDVPLDSVIKVLGENTGQGPRTALRSRTHTRVPLEGHQQGDISLSNAVNSIIEMDAAHMRRT
jgi:hypothetical protein